jgi:hypothetical protein
MGREGLLPHQTWRQSDDDRELEGFVPVDQIKIDEDHRHLMTAHQKTPIDEFPITKNNPNKHLE